MRLLLNSVPLSYVEGGMYADKCVFCTRIHETFAGGSYVDQRYIIRSTQSPPWNGRYPPEVARMLLNLQRPKKKKKKKKKRLIP